MFCSYTNESALAFYHNLANGMDPDDAYVMSEGAFTDRVKLMNGKEVSNINKELRALQRCKRKGDKAEVEKHRKEALKQLEDLKKKAKEIPDDSWVSYAGRIAGGIAVFAATMGLAGAVGKAAGAGAMKASTAMNVARAGGSVGGAGLVGASSGISDIIAAKMNGDDLKEVSRKTCLRSIDQTITAVKSM